MSTSPFGTLAVIADPEAGHGRVGAQLEEVRRAFRGTGLDHRFEVASHPGDLERMATAALDEGLRYVAAVGDDRTVRAIVAGLFRDGRPIVESPVLAVVPAGSDCDLIRSFGLPTDLAASVEHLPGENVYPLDVMKIAVTNGRGDRDVRYAANLAEVGLHAAADGGPGRLRRFLGFWTAYLRNGVRQVHVETDAKARDVRAWSVIVGNGQFADGGLRLSPRSFPGDGVLDALVFTGPKADAYRLLPRIFRHGDHIPDPGIVELRAKLTVRVDADRPMPVSADGETIGTTPVTFQLVPQPIRLKL